MSQGGRRFLLGSAGVAVLVLLLGAGIVWPTEVAAVTAGVGAAVVFQLLGYWLLGVVLFPTRPMLAYVLGMMGRLLMVGVAAIIAPRAGLPLAPVLLTLVSVFALTTLLEPLTFQLETKSAS